MTKQQIEQSSALQAFARNFEVDLAVRFYGSADKHGLAADTVSAWGQSIATLSNLCALVGRDIGQGMP